jgi:hypothetical protein
MTLKLLAGFACGVYAYGGLSAVERASCFIVSRDKNAVYYIITGAYHERHEARSF